MAIVHRDSPATCIVQQGAAWLVRVGNSIVAVFDSKAKATAYVFDQR
jgi:hypothetical protein